LIFRFKNGKNIFMNIQDKNQAFEKTPNKEERAGLVSWESGRLILFMLLLFAILVNLVPFHALSFRSGMSGYPAIAKLGVISGDTIRHRRGLYLALKQTAPGTNIILPNGCSLDIAQLYGLGRAENVMYRDYNPKTIFPDFNPSNHVVAAFNGSRRLGPGPFAIAKGEGKPATMIVLIRNNVWHIVDTSLLPLNDD
jgi:hypothetical protein